MKALSIVITALGLAIAAPFASADTAQLELLPRVGGAEMTSFAAPGAIVPSPSHGDAFWYAHTGGVSPQ